MAAGAAALLAASVLLAGLSACGGLRLPAPEPVRAEYTLRGEVPEVHVVAGRVRVEPGPGDAVSVTVRRLGRDSSVLSVRVDRGAGGDALWVVTDAPRLLYPDMPKPDSVEVKAGSGGFRAARRGLLTPHTTVVSRSSQKGDSAHAEVVVRVPAGARLGVDVAAGELLASGTTAELHLTSVAAPVTAEDARGALRIETANALATARRVLGDVAIDVGRGGASLDSVGGARLAVQSTAGSITADRLYSGEISLGTEAGSVSVHGARTDLLRIDSHAGAIEGRGIAARRLEVENGAGDVELDGVGTEDGTLRAGAGDVAVSLDGSVRSLWMKVDGSVRLALPAGLDAELRLKGDDGVELGVPAQVLRRGHGSLVARLGTGAGTITVDADDRLVVVGREVAGR